MPSRDLTIRETPPSGDLPDPDPPVPAGLTAIRRLIGTSSAWLLERLVLGRPLSARYIFFQAGEISNPKPNEPRFLAAGVDVTFDAVVAGYLEDTDEYLIVDPSFLADNIYFLRFIDDDHVVGCYFGRNRQTGSLSECFPVQGSRLDAIGSLAVTPLEGTSSRRQSLEGVPRPSIIQAVNALSRRLMLKGTSK